MIERDLEHLDRSLALLARAIAYPRTPPIAECVGERLTYEATSTRTAPAWALAGIALAGLVVLLSALIGALSPARNTIAEVFDAINIFQTDDLPANVSREFEGTPSSLAGAEETLGFRIPLPSFPNDLTPKVVLLQDFGVVKAAVLFFTTRPRESSSSPPPAPRSVRYLAPKPRQKPLMGSMETPTGSADSGSSATMQPATLSSRSRCAPLTQTR